MAVAIAEEDAQHPTDQADHDPGKERGPEAGHVKSGDDLGNEEDQQGVDHEDEETHRHDDEGEAQEEQNRAHQGIDNPEEEGGSKQGPHGVVRDAGNEPSSSQNREGGDEPTEEKLFHNPSIGPLMVEMAPKNLLSHARVGIPFAYKE